MRTQLIFHLRAQNTITHSKLNKTSWAIQGVPKRTTPAR